MASKLIFVVEDDDAVRNSTSTLLEALGYKASVFSNAELLLARAGDQACDCLVLDHHLPGMSGIDLLEALRARGVTTPAIMVTGNGPHLEERALRAGALVTLRKPLSADLLSQWLEKVFAPKA